LTATLGGRNSTMRAKGSQQPSIARAWASVSDAGDREQARRRSVDVLRAVGVVAGAAVAVVAIVAPSTAGLRASVPAFAAEGRSSAALLAAAITPGRAAHVSVLVDPRVHPFIPAIAMTEAAAAFNDAATAPDAFALAEARRASLATKPVAMVLISASTASGVGPATPIVTAAPAVAPTPVAPAPAAPPRLSPTAAASAKPALPASSTKTATKSSGSTNRESGPDDPRAKATTTTTTASSRKPTSTKNADGGANKSRSKGNHHGDHGRSHGRANGQSNNSNN
jgi:hypothetical protein